jgi:hypothetical protein
MSGKHKSDIQKPTEDGLIQGLLGSAERVVNFAIVLVGVVCMLSMSYAYALYVKQLHENYLWFSEITVGFRFVASILTVLELWLLFCRKLNVRYRFAQNRASTIRTTRNWC